ncbi:MAG: hypothetical protein A2Z96_02105 [Spirochaetes bacterium GWB1_48_6]|nr:MAG: hypothetical protein A2Z96_02105 [Spirochaetes bacterium GWB1_48_6]
MSQDTIIPPTEWVLARNTIINKWMDFFYWLIKGQFPWRETWEQFKLVILNGWMTVFMGSVVQGIFVMWMAGFYGDMFGGYIWVGTVTTFAVFRELAVLMCTVLFAARIGTAFTVEIGSMQMSEQISALKIMDVEPNTYLVIPRVIASTLAVPLFVGFSFGVAIFISWIFMAFFWDLSFEIFFLNAFSFIDPGMLTNSLLRALTIGFVTGLNAVALGFYPCNGAEDLGKATTKSMVINLFSLLLIDLAIGMVSASLSMGAPT